MPRAGSHRLPPVGKESLRAAIRKAAKIFEDFSFLVKGKNCRVGRFGTCSRTSGRELHAVWLESLLCAVRRRFLFLATVATVTWRGRPTQTAPQVVAGVTWRIDAPHSQPATTHPVHASSFTSPSPKYLAAPLNLHDASAYVFLLAPHYAMAVGRFLV